MENRRKRELRFLLDANVQLAVARALRDQGHDVVRVSEVDPRMTDSQVLDLARAQDRILMTNDKDFGELVFLRGQSAPGILLLRLLPGDANEIAKTVLDVVRTTGNRLNGQFAVVTDRRIRLRRLGPS